ncbi:MAG: nucleotidyltransferase family protein [Oscillospiraceae bacterium]|nr:nucleotidyltransferase family protein [Oscillospiraceae bacterium]
MKTVGIICEYNPLHLGHKKQLDRIRSQYGADCGIVCLMSGNYVQRGAPAIFDRSLRAKAAILSGADLVLELPVTAALSSAEGFAAGGVRFLSPFCDVLSFGSETADGELLLSTAQALLSEAFPPALRLRLEEGLSFPAARAAALRDFGHSDEVLSTPNNILAVEYCKAILSQNSSMIPSPILRKGSYHDTAADPENPSATALRQLILNGEAWNAYVPEQAQPIFDGAVTHCLAAGERAILARLRTMTDAEFEALPYSSEGLWRKLMHASRQCSTVEQIAAATKSKRYTRTRIDRMILCAFLGLTAEDLATPAPYTRVLAFNDKGRTILNTARQTGLFPNLGEKQDHPYQQLEDRCDALYGLFAANTPEPPITAPRITYLR